MRTLRLDDHNNLVVAQGNLSVLSDVEACAQNTKTRLGLYLGENPLNQEEGIDYDNSVLGKAGGETYVKNIIQNRILESDEIRNVSALTLTREGDTLVCEATINSIYGAFQL